MSLALRSNLSSPSLSFPVLPVPRFLPLQLLPLSHSIPHPPAISLSLTMFVPSLAFLKPFTQDQVAGVKGGLREKERERTRERFISKSA